MGRVFISHANKDKPLIAPVLTELVRIGVPFFVDQKHAFGWPEDVREKVVKDDHLVEAIGEGDYSERIARAIDECALFVVLFTDGVFDAASVWKETGRYCRSLNTQNRPKPLIVQASKVSQSLKIPVSPFLDDDMFRLNIQTLHESAFTENRSAKEVSDIVYSRYQTECIPNLNEQHLRLRIDSAKRHMDGRLEIDTKITPFMRLRMSYVPNSIPTIPGCFVSLNPLDHRCAPTHYPIDRNSAIALLENMPSRFNAITSDILKMMFPLRSYGVQSSPFGFAPHTGDDSFWIFEDSELKTVGQDLAPRSTDRAFFYAQR